jgi:hypothetical protein
MWGQDSVWQASEDISTGDVVVLDTTFERGIRKAVSGETKLLE